MSETLKVYGGSKNKPFDAKGSIKSISGKIGDTIENKRRSEQHPIDKMDGFVDV